MMYRTRINTLRVKQSNNYRYYDGDTKVIKKLNCLLTRKVIGYCMPADEFLGLATKLSNLFNQCDSVEQFKIQLPDFLKQEDDLIEICNEQFQKRLLIQMVEILRGNR